MKTLLFVVAGLLALAPLAQAKSKLDKIIDKAIADAEWKKTVQRAEATLEHQLQLGKAMGMSEEVLQYAIDCGNVLGAQAYERDVWVDKLMKSQDKHIDARLSKHFKEVKQNQRFQFKKIVSVAANEELSRLIIEGMKK
jgi:hypothetical protein